MKTTENMFIEEMVESHETQRKICCKIERRNIIKRFQHTINIDVCWKEVVKIKSIKRDRLVEAIKKSEVNIRTPIMDAAL